MSSSITFQVMKCIDEVNGIGKSKRENRKRIKKGQEKYRHIHSYKTMEEVEKIGKQFARYVRENFGVNNLHELKEQHYIEFLKSKSHLTLDYQRNIETNLRLVQEGFHKRAERLGKEIVRFIPEKRIVSSRERMEGVSNRSYTKDEIERLKGRVSASVNVSLSLMYNLGVRVSESVEIAVGDVDFQNNTVHVVGKGGRPRIVDIPENYKHELRSLVQGKGLEDKLCPVKAGTVRNAIAKGFRKEGIKCKGAHGFRHTYARNQIKRIMTTEERNLFQNCISRYAEGKAFDYGVHNRQLYDSMKAKMDYVHIQLGHGKDRFDLAVRYMK